MKNRTEMKQTTSVGRLNPDQYRLLNGYILDGKEESFVMRMLSHFDVNPEDQADVYRYFVEQNKAVQITELDEGFKGLQIATDHDLNGIINIGYTGDWKLDINEAVKCERIRIFSMVDRGTYLIAKISSFELLPSGRYKIHLEQIDMCKHENPNLKFTRNVIRYVNVPRSNKQRKNK